MRRLARAAQTGYSDAYWSLDGLTTGTPGMAGTDNQASADTTGFGPRRVTPSCLHQPLR
jgi:hypothetical protein